MRRRPWHASSNAPPNLRALLFFGFFVSACCPLAPPVSSPSFKIRAARVSDAEAIAELLTAVFEAPLLKWYELPERQARRGRYQQAIGARLVAGRSGGAGGVDEGQQQFMVVAEAVSDSGGGGIGGVLGGFGGGSAGESGELVGFAEVGMLPPPPGYLDSLLAEPDEESSSEGSGGVGGGVISSADVPYLANLCVAGAARRQGLGRRLVELCSKWAATATAASNAAAAATTTAVEGASPEEPILHSPATPCIFATVDEAVVGRNDAARSFYEGLGFAAVPPPRDPQQRLRAFNRARIYYARPFGDPPPMQMPMPPPDSAATATEMAG
jgi:GNAT superfamily N-acetyltransferase